MSEIYLYEDEAYYLPGALPLIRTDRFDQSLQKYTGALDKELRKLAEKRYFMMRYFENHGEPTYEILMDYGVLKCKLKPEENAFLVTHITPKDTLTVNRFMRYSAKIHVEKGAVLFSKKQADVSSTSLTSNQATQQFKEYLENLANFIQIKSNYQSGSTKNETIEVNDELSFEFQEAIDTAEQLVLMEDDIENIKAQTAGAVYYTKIEAVEHEERIRKIPYKFRIIEGGGFEITAGIRVYINLTSDEQRGGVVKEVGSDNDGPYAVILFDQVPSIDQVDHVGGIMLEHNKVQRQVRLAVIEQIRNQQTIANYMNNVFGRNEFLPHKPIKDEEIHALLAESNLRANDSQFEAIKRGITSQDALLVLGPPGTGKTTVILAWVKYFVKQGMRVLISSQNNKAVDNVLERLSLEKNMDMIRIGREEKVQSNVFHLLFENRSNDVHNMIVKSHEQYHEKIQSILLEVSQLIDKLDVLFVYSTKLQTTMNEKQIVEVQFEDQHAKPVEAALIKKEQLKSMQIEIDQSIKEKQQYVDSYNEKSAAAKILQFGKKSWISQQLKKLKKNQILIQEQFEAAWNDYVTKEQSQLAFIDQTLAPIQRLFDELFQQWQSFIQMMGNYAIQHIDDEEYTFNVEDLSAENSVEETKKMSEEIFKMKLQLIALRDILDDWLNLLQEKKNYALTRIVIDGVDVVGATCVGINSQTRFEELEFDVAIVDEAGQIQLHNVLVPLSRAKKMIMLGDHKQIPPSVEEELVIRMQNIGLDLDYIEKSYFEILYEQFPDSHKILLDTQYRMPSEIANLLSDQFYDGKYKSFDGKKGMSSLFEPVFTKPFVLIDTQHVKYRGEKRNEEQGGYYNKHEADVVIKLFQYIVEGIEEGRFKEFQLEDIGVITPYRSQVDYIKEQMKKKFPNYKKVINEIVASLDSFQGQERKIIIYSFVRSNTIPPSNKRIGFLKELRRLNVALSRCQQQLFVVGDYRFLGECEFELEQNFSEFIHAMLEHAENGQAQLISSDNLNDYLEVDNQ